MADFILFIGGLLLTYVMFVAVVAATGPHNETERREYEAFKHEKRRKRQSNGGGNV